MLKPNIGDLVRIKPMEVVRVDNDGFFHTIFEGMYFMWPESAIDAILPRPISVGDRVRHMEVKDCLGNVVAIKNGKAFVDWDAKPYATRNEKLDARCDIKDVVRVY